MSAVTSQVMWSAYRRLCEKEKQVPKRFPASFLCQDLVKRNGNKSSCFRQQTPQSYGQGDAIHRAQT